MDGMIDMDTGAVLHLGAVSHHLSPLASEAGKPLVNGWLPRSNPTFKQVLHDTQLYWTGSFSALSLVIDGIGDKLKGSAGSVIRGDDTSADQF